MSSAAPNSPPDELELLAARIEELELELAQERAVVRALVREIDRLEELVSMTGAAGRG